MLTKPILKQYLDPKAKISKDDLVMFQRYIKLRVDYRDKEKELKSTLKKVISPIISEQYKHLIGVVERELYESFYCMSQVNVKYKKRIPKSNYIDYLSVRELQGLNILKECMIERLSKHNNLTIDMACSLANKVGFQVRKWFVEKYRMLPENMPADEVSYAVCKSSIKKCDDILRLYNLPPSMTYEKEDGQVAMNFDVMFKKTDDKRDR